MLANPIKRRTLLAGLGSVAVLTGGVARAAVHDDAALTLPWGGLELLDANGERFRVDRSAKPFTLIKVWANWCSACLPDLNRLAEIAPRLGSRNADVVLISHPQDWDRNQEVATERGITFRRARPSGTNAPSTIRAAFVAPDGSYYVPRSMLFSQAHQAVVWSHIGGMDWTRPVATATLDRWLA